MSWKRIIGLCLVAVLLLAGAGCSDDDDDNGVSPTSPVPSVAEDLAIQAVPHGDNVTGNAYLADSIQASRPLVDIPLYQPYPADVAGDISLMPQQPGDTVGNETLNESLSKQKEAVAIPLYSQ